MKKILVVNSNYYKSISKNLIDGAKSVLKNKVKISIINVAGIFEIPYVIRKNVNKFDGFVALGCVIKGETPHFDLISKSTFYGIIDLTINFNKPISNGIITANNMKQAIKRSLLKKMSKPNKGIEASNAIISVLKNDPKKT
jgi:6,7-dimethyl-8-ribityllumazine synthase